MFTHTGFNPPPEVGYVTQIAIQTRISLIWIGMGFKIILLLTLSCGEPKQTVRH